jgi:hypothetical protein
VYRSRDRRGEKLALTHFTGTDLVPERVTFPPATVLTGGWPGWLTVREATERVEDTLDRRLEQLAAGGDFATLELWLYRFLETRRSGWQRGVFSIDAHLKNFGVIGNRVVLLDTGGVTNRWQDIAERLSKDEQVQEPHVQLGLEELLAGQPELARAPRRSSLGLSFFPRLPHRRADSVGSGHFSQLATQQFPAPQQDQGGLAAKFCFEKLKSACRVNNLRQALAKCRFHSFQEFLNRVRFLEKTRQMSFGEPVHRLSLVVSAGQHHG